MKIGEILTELEFIRLRIYRLRLRNKSSPWFAHVLKAAENLIAATKVSVADIQKGVGTK